MHMAMTAIPYSLEFDIISSIQGKRGKVKSKSLPSFGMCSQSKEEDRCRSATRPPSTHRLPAEVSRCAQERGRRTGGPSRSNRWVVVKRRDRRKDNRTGFSGQCHIAQMNAVEGRLSHARISGRRSLSVTSAARAMSELARPWAMAASVPIEQGRIIIPFEG